MTNIPEQVATVQTHGKRCYVRREWAHETSEVELIQVGTRGQLSRIIAFGPKTRMRADGTYGTTVTLEVKRSPASIALELAAWMDRATVPQTIEQGWSLAVQEIAYQLEMAV